MTKTRASASVVLLAGLIGIALTSCSVAPQWEQLTADEATDADALPDDVWAQDALGDIDPDSVRLQWSSDEVSYYSALSASQADLGCLVVLPSDDDAVTACGVQPPVVYGEITLGTAAPSAGWEQLSPVLWREP